MIGRLLNGRYKIVRKVGSGGMADVYEGFDTKENRTVAIKVLKEEYSNDPQYLRRLSREARAMVTLKNEHIVTLYDMGNDGDIHYLILEYVNGITLRELMDENGAMKPREATEIICDVLDGLSHAHKMGLIHRDVKPQNIMVTEDGCIKLTDFGIAKFTDNSTKTYEGTEAMGSVYYISPEQAKGESVDAQADLYSAGVMLYEMLTGKPPFSGDNAVQVALKHINEDITPLHEVDPKISIAMSDVVEKATSKDRELRYSDADEMRNDLHKALRYPQSRFAKVEKKDEETEGGSGPRRNRLREHLPLIAIIGSVIGVIALFAVMFIISMTKGSSKYTRVPNLIGLTESVAQERAENRNLKIEIRGYEPSDEIPAGEVCEQDPPAQSKAEPGSTILVTISSGNNTVAVPKLSGLTVDQARNKLKESGLSLNPHIEYRQSTEPIGTVIAQSPEPGEIVSLDEAIIIIVCGNASADAASMPDLIGSEIGEALEMLKHSHINNYRIYIDTEEHPEDEYQEYQIIDQNPPGGMDIIFDSVTVEITMYRSDAGEYKAEFSENLTLGEGENTVIVTVVTSMGEVVLYSGRHSSADSTLAFTAYYWEGGTYTCKIYVNGTAVTSISKYFDSSET